MPVVVVNGDADFNTKFKSAGGKPIIVDFTASWCGPCQYIAPIFEELSNQYRGALFLKVDVDSCSGTSGSYGVRAMPTFMAFVNGQKKDTIQGANESALRDMVKKYASNVAWTGTGQRLSDVPPSNSRPTSSSSQQPPRQQATSSGSAPPNINNALNNIFGTVNERLRGLGVSDFNVSGFIIQPVHLVIALLGLIFMGPFGLFLAAAIIFFTQQPTGGSTGSNQPLGSGGNPFNQPPSNYGGAGRSTFNGNGQRLGGN